MNSEDGFGNPATQTLLFPFKLLWRIADNSFVQKSAIITGLMMALSAATLAWVGEWAAGGFDENGADAGGGKSGFVATSEPDGSRVAALLPPPDGLAAISGSGSPLSTPGYTIRHTVPEVRLQFTVADEQGRTVQDLTSSEVQVLDNQTAVQHFNDFTHDTDLPLRLGLVIDTSDSVKRLLPEEKLSALHFLQRIMRPSDHAFIMAFGADIHVWQTSTSDREQLMNAVDHVHQPGWGTRFYDAVYSACNEQITHGNDSVPVHRALVVLSDGEDTQSFRDLRDVVAIAQRGEIQVYAISLRGKRPLSQSDLVLQQLAEQTGGRVYVVPSSKELEGVFAALEQELRTQYYVSFTPQQDSPGFHSLQVQVQAPQKVEVHARQGYYATLQ